MLGATPIGNGYAYNNALSYGLQRAQTWFTEVIHADL